MSSAAKPHGALVDGLLTGLPGAGARTSCLCGPAVTGEPLKPAWPVGRTVAVSVHPFHETPRQPVAIEIAVRRAGQPTALNPVVPLALEAAP